MVSDCNASPFNLGVVRRGRQNGNVKSRLKIAVVVATAAVSPVGVNAALQVAQGAAPSPGAASVRGYGVLSQSGGAATAVANVAGTARRSARAAGIADDRGQVGSVVVVARAERGTDGSDLRGTVTASGIRLFGGRVIVDSLSAGVAGHADSASGDAALDYLQVGRVVVDDQPVPVGPGTVISVPGAGEVAFGESTREADGTVRVNVLRVSADGTAGQAPLVIGHFDVTARAGADLSAPAVTVPLPAAPPDAAPAGPPDASAEPGRPDTTDPATRPDRVGPPIRVSPAAPTVPVTPQAPVRPEAHALPGTEPAATGVQGNRFPVQGAYTYSDDYGAPRAGTGWHHGNDVFAPVGTPVVAVADGTLSKVGWNDLGGNRLWLTDGGGAAYYYAHLSAYSASAVDGAVVRAGDVIGYVGNTGQAATTPPHLHFEIHPAGGVDGASVDPFAFLQAWEATPQAAGLTSQGTEAPGGTPAGPDAAAGAVVVGADVDRPTGPVTGTGRATSAR